MVSFIIILYVIARYQLSYNKQQYFTELRHEIHSNVYASRRHCSLKRTIDCSTDHCEMLCIHLTMFRVSVKAKAKARDSHIARLTGKPNQPPFTIIEVAVDRQAPMVLQH